MSKSTRQHDAANTNNSSFENDNEDTSDEFGEFIGEQIETVNYEAYIDQFLRGSEQELHVKTLEQSGSKLTQLLNDERTQIIYRQLVQWEPAPPVIRWRTSSMRKSLLHMLNIKEQEHSKDDGIDTSSLNDTLFKALSRELMLHEKGSLVSETMLRDRFGISYIPPMTPNALVKEEQQHIEKEIPLLITKDLDNAVNLQEIHDKICHAIDVLFAKLAHLQEIQDDLTKDKNTFESVVTNLTGHTQRLYRDEVAFYNKIRSKKKRFSWVSG